jgi:hypothetical protein
MLQSTVFPATAPGKTRWACGPRRQDRPAQPTGEVSRGDGSVASCGWPLLENV